MAEILKLTDARPLDVAPGVRAYALFGEGAMLNLVDLEPGAWRVLADFVPAGGEDLTLGADLTVPGALPEPAPVVEQRVAEVYGAPVRMMADPDTGRPIILPRRHV